MTNRVELEASLSRSRADRVVGAQGRDVAVSYRVGVAILAALACVLAVALLDRIYPSAREVSADASILYGPWRSGAVSSAALQRACGGVQEEIEGSLLRFAMNDETSYWNTLKVEATFEPLTPDDAPKLMALVSVADLGQRRARFGAALCEASVRRHYESLDWTRYFAVGAFIRRRMEAVVEFYPADAEGRRAEIAAMGMRNVAPRLGQGLAASAAHQAKRRGLAELVWIEPDACDPWRSTLLSLGTASALGDHILLRL
jgi:hypothetical protein